MSPSPESPGNCVHCQLPVRGRRFCCSGCFLAHSLLQRAGVEGVRADRLLARLVVSGFLAMGVMAFSLSLYGMDRAVDGESAVALRGLFRLGACALSAPVLLLLGLPLADAVLHLGRRLSAELLILTGVVAAWGVSVWSTFFDGPAVYFETATMVLVLFTLGRWLDVRARERARNRLSILARERTRPAVLVGEEGDAEVATSELRVGDVVRVRPGERVAVDGDVIEGRAFVDTSDLTGEANPVALDVGAKVLAGSRALDGALLVRATAVTGARVRDEVDRLLREATAGRARLVRLADRVAGWFLPAVALLAVATAVGHWAAGPETALLHALSVVLIACPCALGLATPLAFWVALGEAWNHGALVRGGDVLERLARARRIFFDKTGTLTTGEMELRSVRELATLDAREALRLAAALEVSSEHPIGRAVTAGWSPAEGEDLPKVEGFRVLPGRGVEGRVDGVLLRVQRGATSASAVETSVDLVRVDERGEMRLAELRLATTLRPEAGSVIDGLRERRLEAAVLTGDGGGPAKELERTLGVPVEAELLPADKAARIEQAGRRGSVFLGDGLNDAVALASADVGISMRSSSALSLESASVNLLRDDLTWLPGLIDLSRSAVRTAATNLVWAFGYNAIGLALACTGRLTPIFAASAMVVSSVVVVLNSARLRRTPAPSTETVSSVSEDAPFEPRIAERVATS